MLRSGGWVARPWPTLAVSRADRAARTTTTTTTINDDVGPVAGACRVPEVKWPRATRQAGAGAGAGQSDGDPRAEPVGGDYGWRGMVR